MNNKNKHKDWYIDNPPEEGMKESLVFCNNPNGEEWSYDNVHVVEYSVLEAAQAEIEYHKEHFKAREEYWSQDNDTLMKALAEARTENEKLKGLSQRPFCKICGQIFCTDALKAAHECPRTEKTLAEKDAEIERLKNKLTCNHTCHRLGGFDDCPDCNPKYLIDKLAAAEVVIEKLDEHRKILVDRFLRWPLPKSVCSDLCVTQHNYPHPRNGTSLLTADEAKEMIEFIFGEVLSAITEWRGK